MVGVEKMRIDDTACGLWMTTSVFLSQPENRRNAASLLCPFRPSQTPHWGGEARVGDIACGSGLPAAFLSGSENMRNAANVLCPFRPSQTPHWGGEVQVGILLAGSGLPPEYQ